MKLRTNSWAYQITRLQIYPMFLKTVSKWTSENLPGCGFYSLVPTSAGYLYLKSLGHAINSDCRPGLLWSAPGTARPRAFAVNTKTVEMGKVISLWELRDLGAFPVFTMPANLFLWHIVNSQKCHWILTRTFYQVLLLCSCSPFYRWGNRLREVKLLAQSHVADNSQTRSDSRACALTTML